MNELTLHDFTTRAETIRGVVLVLAEYENEEIEALLDVSRLVKDNKIQSDTKTIIDFYNTFFLESDLCHCRFNSRLFFIGIY